LLSNKDNQAKFTVLFDTLLANYLSITTPQDSAHVVSFLIHCFESLENETVRGSCLKIVSLPMWTALNPARFVVFITF
jgi:hypothetical protein